VSGETGGAGRQVSDVSSADLEEVRLIRDVSLLQLKTELYVVIELVFGSVTVSRSVS